MKLTKSGLYGKCTPCCNGICIAACRGGSYWCQHCGHWEEPYGWRYMNGEWEQFDPWEDYEDIEGEID